MKISSKFLYAILFLTLGLSSFVYADSERDIAIDQAIAGMEEGSRMLAPESPEMPGTALSPAADTKVIISPAAQKEIVSPEIEAQGGNFPGGVVSGPSETGVSDLPSQPADTEITPGSGDLGSGTGGTEVGGTVETPQEPIGETVEPIIDVDTGVDAGSGTVDADVGVNPGGGQLLDADVIGSQIDADVAGEPPSQEPAQETTEPIIDVDAGVDLDSGTVEADVGVNPSGDQLLDADLTESAGGSQGEAQIDIGSAMDIPIEDDIGDPEEPTDATSSPIIDIDASADLDSGTVEADVGVNPSGDQLLDADLGGTGADTTGTVEADIGSTSDLIGQDLTVVSEPVSVITPPSGLSAEIDTTSETVGGTTDVGVEADVSGTGAGEDVVDDPTDDGIGGL